LDFLVRVFVVVVVLQALLLLLLLGDEKKTFVVARNTEARRFRRDQQRLEDKELRYQSLSPPNMRLSKWAQREVEK
jgi:hypothetical protein